MLTGTLDDFTLPDVLRLIAGARRTGGLTVSRDGGAGNLYFRDGTVSRGVARYDRRTEPSTPARAVEDLAFDLMRWDRGEFTWTAGSATPAGPEAAVDVDDLLREVSRRLEELAEIQTLVPSEEAVLTMAPQPPQGAVQINITPAEWRVLVLVDGHRTVSEVAGAAHLDDLEAMKLLYGLAAAGLVTAGPPAAAPPDVMPRPEPVTDVTAVTAVSASLLEDIRMPPEAPEAEQPEPQPEPEPRAEAEPEPETEAEPEPETEAEAEPEPEPHAEAQPEPGPDPFLAELAIEPFSPFDGVPLSPEGAHEEAAVDRSTAARELAGLFDDPDPMTALGGMSASVPPPPGAPVRPRRVEDDDQVTRGLISRLIDGVKGL